MDIIVTHLVWIWPTLCFWENILANMIPLVNGKKVKIYKNILLILFIKIYPLGSKNYVNYHSCFENLPKSFQPHKLGVLYSDCFLISVLSSLNKSRTQDQISNTSLQESCCYAVLELWTYNTRVEFYKAYPISLFLLFTCVGSLLWGQRNPKTLILQKWL